MNKSKIIIIIIIAFIGGMALKIFHNKISQESHILGYKIGIIQVASHPALDRVCNAFMNTLQNALHDQVTFRICNAQGSIEMVQTCAQTLAHDRSLDGFLVIGTPALQALSLLEDTRPIVFAAITNPAAIISPEKNNNITGVCDMINPARAVESITKLLPAIKTVAFIYNNGEANAVFSADLLKKALEQKGIQHLSFYATNETDLISAAQVAVHKADALIAPIDNTVALTIQTLAHIARTAQKPFIVSDPLLVEQGAWVGYGVDYAQQGQQAAQLMYAILHDHQTPQSLPIQYPESITIAVNPEFTNSLNSKKE